jgi:hypothetical protein
MNTRPIAAGIALLALTACGVALADTADAPTTTTTTTTAAPTTTAPPTTTAAPTTAAPTTADPLPAILDTLNATYRWDEHSTRVTRLQILLGTTPDGHYGPRTHRAHLEALNYYGQPTTNTPTPPTTAKPAKSAKPAATTTTTTGTGTTGTGNTCPQWETTALAAGWTPTQTARLTKIMWRESRCNPNAYNPHNRDRSYGLIQINTKGNLWNELQTRCGLTTKEQLFDPYTNLHCGKQLHNAYGWKPWRT